MSTAAKSVMYIVGLTAAGGALFYAFTPASDSKTFKKMNENQGVLTRDVSDAQKNTSNLLKKLKEEAGLNADKKKS